MMRNGVCQRKRQDGARDHDMRQKVDGAGRKYEACKRCGTMFITPAA